MTSLEGLSWTDANQRVMVAEFSRLKLRLGAEGDDAAADASLQQAYSDLPSVAAIDRITDAFGLSPFERDVLLLSAGVEMDATLAALCASAAAETRTQGVTFGLALAALDQPHWSALAPVRPLRRWRLVEVDDGAGIARGRVRIDERVLHYLAGVNYLDVRVSDLVREARVSSEMATSHQAIAASIRAAIMNAVEGDTPAVWVTGNDAHAQADVASRVAVGLGQGLYSMQMSDVPTGHAEIEALATLWEREASLLGCALLVNAGTEPLSASAARFVEHLRSLVFVTGGQAQALDRVSLRYVVDKPEAPEQRELWQRALGDAAPALEVAIAGIASQFRLSARTIQAEGARIGPVITASEDGERLLWSECRVMGRAKLDELAQRIESGARWDDLVLPEPQKDMLRQIVSHVRNRIKVHDEWGFADTGARGMGISALFAGESGTGKTMAAEVLARELQLDLYRIDLSAVVSKYIGETEKNLRRLFDAAEESGAILLFDEADALFGKRSEVKDSHDRYANIEVSYLLQRMESYRGLAILTSNLKTSLDTAFQRRLRFVVQFPFPDHALREAIWKGAFPARAQLGSVDTGKLARLNVTGGSIRNIAINAAFRAADVSEAVGMSHLLRAAYQEASKRDRPLSDAETRGWV